MTLFSRLSIAIVLTAAVTSYGCTSQSDEYVVSTTQGHAVYKIWKPGEIIRDENYDVALVYGFSDNPVVAQQIVDFLNQEEPNTCFLSEVE